MPQTLPEWLSDPALSVIWARVRDRVERNGLLAEGRLRVRLETREIRHGVGALLGRPATSDTVTIDLAVLDARLRERSGVGGLLPVLDALAEGPLRNRPAERAASDNRREHSLALLQGAVHAPWVEDWVADVRRSGLLARTSDPERVAREAASVLPALLAEQPSSGKSRVELAAQLLGDAHALDEDRTLHRLLLRALAAASDVPVPDSVGGRWALWERYGVAPDAISATCLTLGLTGDGGGAASQRLHAAVSAGDPVHLTRWDLRRLEASPRPARRGPVLVCENPRVLEAIAETYAGRVPVACTSGEPNSVVRQVLGDLAELGVPLLYHGDLDWPGVAIANRLVARFDVQPWLMSAADYEKHVHPEAPVLSGKPVEPVWDPELGAVMRARGRGLHEETMLPDLLAQLPAVASVD